MQHRFAPLIAAFEMLVSAIVPVRGILTSVVEFIMGFLAPVITWLGERKLLIPSRLA